MTKEDISQKQRTHQKQLIHSKKMLRKIAIANTFYILNIDQRLCNYERALVIDISNDKNNIFDFERILIFENLITARHKGLEIVSKTKTLKKIIFGKNPIKQENAYTVKIKTEGSQPNHFSINFGSFFETQKSNQILKLIFARRMLFNSSKFIQIIEDYADMPRNSISVTDLGSSSGVYIKITAPIHRLRVGDVLILPSCHQIKIAEIIHKRHLSINSEKTDDKSEYRVLNNLNIENEKMKFKNKVESIKEIWTCKGLLGNSRELKLLDELFEIENSFDFLVLECEGLVEFGIERYGLLVVNDIGHRFVNGFLTIEVRHSQFLIHKEDYFNILWKLVGPFGKNKHVPTDIELITGDELMIEGAVLKLEELKN